MGLEPGRIENDRRAYDGGALDESSLPASPKQLFEAWLSHAYDEGVRDPNAMVLSTADAAGVPSSRVVLAKGIDGRGIVFYTNYSSRKGQEIRRNHHAAVLFHWRELDRAVRIEGAVARVPAEESDAYFRSRPPASNIGAMVSPQSEVIGSRQALLAEFDALAERIEAGEQAITRPDHWGGYVVIPSRVEFWQGRADRLHDRICYRRDGGSWVITRLAP